MATDTFQSDLNTPDPSLVQELQTTQRSQMAQSLDKAVDVNPEQAAATQQLAAKTGLPVAAIEGREKEVQRDYNLRQERLDMVANQYPALRDSLQNSDFANVSHDDIEKLMRVEEVAPAIALGESTTFDRTRAGVENASKYPAFIAYRLTDDPQKKDALVDFILDRADVVQNVNERQPGRIQQFQRQYDHAPGAISGLGVLLTNPGATAQVYGTQMPGQLIAPIGGAVVGGRVGGVAGAVAGGVATAPAGGAGAIPGAAIGTTVGSLGGFYTGSAANYVGSWVEQELQARGIDIYSGNRAERKAALRAALDDPEISNEIYAKAERYGLTAAAVDTILMPIAGKYLAAAATKPLTAKAVGAATDLAIQTAGSGASEALGQTAAYGDPTEVSGKAVMENMLLSAGTNIGEIAIGVGTHRVRVNEAAVKAGAEEAANEKTAQVDLMNATARDTKLATRNPDMLKSLVEKAAPGEEIFIDGQKGVEFFQSLPPERQQDLLNVVPDLQDKLQEAAVAGTDIPISKADYFAHIAPHEEADALREHIRFGPDDWTADQLRNIESLVDDAAEEFARQSEALTPEEQVGRRLESELRNAGRPTEVARLEASLAQANMETFGLRYGGNAKAASIIADAYNNLSVRAHNEQPFVTRKVDNLDLVIDSARNEATGKKKPPALPVEKKYPVLNFLKEQGGVRRASTLGGELVHIGVDNKTLPGVLRRGEGPGRGFFGRTGKEDVSIDNIPASEWKFSDNPPTDGNGYVDPAFILESIREELAGRPLRSEADRRDVRPEDALNEELHQLGIDVATATNEEIKKALKDAAEAYRSGQASEFFQGSKESPRGSIQYFPDGRAVINIFENADLSTVLHEMGHFYWGLMDKLKTEGALSEEGAKDWATMREFVGIEEGKPLDVNAEEKIARAFEAYLMEGKAPSVGLAAAFERFKAWLSHIYKSVAGLNVRLNNDVRAVFDRMLASDEQIESMRDLALFKPDANVLAVLPADAQKAYIRQGEKAALSAKEKLFKRAMRDKRVETTQWYKAEKAKVEQEITARVSESAVYKALDAMQKGELPDGTPMGEPIRLSKSMLREQFGPEILKYMPRATTEEGRKGSDPQQVAEMFGFNSADSFVMAIINAQPKKEKIAQLVEETMRERHGDVLTDGTIERAATEEYHNMDRARQMATELKTASDLAGVGSATPEQFAAAAQRILGAKKIDEAVKTSRFYYAEVRAAREFGKAMAAKDYPKAADAKRRQLLNHFLFKQASEADREITSALKKFAKLEKPPVAGKVKIDEDYHARIREILAGYGFGSRLSSRRELKLELQAIADWMKRKEVDDEAQLSIPPEILSARNKTHYRDMTLEEFRAMRDMVLNIEMQGRRKLEYTLNGKTRAFEAVRDDILARMAPLPVIEKQFNPSPLGELAEKFFSVQTKARSYFRQLDSGEMNGVIHDAFLAPIDAGVDRFHVRLKDAGDKFRELLEASYSREELANMPRHKFNVEGIGDGVTKENLILMALNWGNEGNREALLNGGGWTHESVDRVLKERLTAKDWQFVQGTWDWINSYWPEISKLEKARKGFTPKKVEALPFATPHGDMKGGYFPIVADPRKSIKAGEQTLDEAMKQMRTGSMAAAATRRGHTVQRVGVGLDPRPLYLSFSVIPTHVSTVLRDIELGEAVHGVSRLLRNRDIKNSISDRLGNEAFRQLDIWLKDVAVGDMPMSDAFTRIQDKLRSNASIAYMGFSLSTLVQQPGGLAQSAAVLGNGGRGWKWIGVGLQQLMKSWASDGAMSTEEIHNVSEFMRMRAQTFQRDINDTLALINRNAASNLHIGDKYMPHDYKKWFLWHIQKIQTVVDSAVWLGSREKAIAEGKDEAAAIKYADDVVRSQASGLIQDLSGLERGSTSTGNRLNKWTKLFTFMFSYWNAKYNIARDKMVDLKADRISGGEFALDMISLIWIDALFGGLVTATLPGMTDSDKEDKRNAGPGDWAWWTLKQPLSMLPLGRDIPSALEGNSPYSGPWGTLVGAGGNLAGQLKQGKGDVALVKAGINFTGLAVGLPSAQINRIISTIDRVENNKPVGYVDLVRARRPQEK